MTHYIKYPRTFHVPWTGGKTSDDKMLSPGQLASSTLAKGAVVVTTKRDGENTSLYRDHYHARSLDSRHHPSRDWVKGLHGRISYLIPEGWRICGENLYARHSIEYRDLESYLEVFSIWNEKNEALSWSETKEWCELLGLRHVPVLYEGPFDAEKLRELADGLDPQTQEGYVVRVAGSFHYDDFSGCVAKYVCEEFHQALQESDEHWMHKEVVPNQLRED